MPVVRKVSAEQCQPQRWGRRPESFIRVERRMDKGRERTMLYVGRALWYGLGRPARLDVQHLRGRLVLTPAPENSGYAVNVGTSMPRFWGPRHIVDHMPVGRYGAEVREGRIIVGEALGELDLDETSN